MGWRFTKLEICCSQFSCIVMLDRMLGGGKTNKECGTRQTTCPRFTRSILKVHIFYDVGRGSNVFFLTTNIRTRERRRFTKLDSYRLQVYFSVYSWFCCVSQRRSFDTCVNSQYNRISSFAARALLHAYA